MFLLHMFLLLIDWGLFILSEKTFPALDDSLSATSHWFALMLFNPLHMFISFFLFLSALLLLRHLMIKNSQRLRGSNALFRAQRYEVLVPLFLGILLVGYIAWNYTLVAALIGGPIALYDFHRYTVYARKQKRLKMAFRQMRE